MKYLIKWKNEVVGEIQSNDEGKYKYIPNIDKINKLKNEGIPSALVIETENGVLPEFLKKRLQLNTQNNSVTATDHFSIVRA